jgi:Flp pilus assembly protein TadD
MRSPERTATIDYRFGSGNHASSYLSRTPSGSLVELPLTWYSENGGFWHMSPSYDRPDNPGFNRKITDRCLFCHTAYPKNSTDISPINCERCHGSGEGHRVVNPAKLSPERSMEICLQCHLETSSLRLPAALLRPGRDVYSYRPGEPLSDYIVHFDRAQPDPGRFEFANAPYRLRMSACFLKSQGSMTCTTCHDPHGAKVSYTDRCKTCHATLTASHSAQPDCIGCHMPRRHPSDAVHVSVADHFIRKLPPPADVNPVERHDANTPPYRGEVRLYYPAQLPASPQNELVLAVAQVTNQSNLSAGIPRLEAAIRKYQPVDEYFTFELAEAYRASGQPDKAVEWYRRGNGWRSLYALGLTLTSQGKAAEALDPLRRAAVLSPKEAAIRSAIGKASRTSEPYREALALDPDSPEIHNDLATSLLREGNAAEAELHLREAVTLRPESAAIRLNLAELLTRRNKFSEAQPQFEAALALNGNNATSNAQFHSAYATALATIGELAAARIHYEKALQLNPNLPITHNNYGIVLMRQGDAQSAVREFTLALKLQPDYKEALDNLAAAGKR